MEFLGHFNWREWDGTFDVVWATLLPGDRVSILYGDGKTKHEVSRAYFETHAVSWFNPNL